MIQAEICRRLQVLHLLHFVDRDLSHRYPSTLSKSALSERVKEDIRILDALAACLASGEQGDVVAAALDLRFPSQPLILAKNTPPTADDDAKVREFLQLLSSPETKRHDDVFSFLLHHCRAGLRRRVEKLSLAATSMHFVPSDKYDVRTLKEEFPNHRNVEGPGREYPVVKIYKFVYESILSKCTSVLSNMADCKLCHEAYFDLHKAF